MKRTREELIEDIEYYTERAECYTKLAKKFTPKWAERYTSLAEKARKELEELDGAENEKN